jgi:hypothetical protein
LIGGFFVFILCLIAAQTCYFGARWIWFWLAVTGAIVSAACMGDEVYQWLTPPENQQTIVVRQPTTPL